MEKPPPILGYRSVPPPQVSGVPYLCLIVFALIRLFISAGLALSGLIFAIGGVMGLYTAGRPDDMACSGVVWGPILFVVASRWFRRAVEILMAGKTYNRHY